MATRDRASGTDPARAIDRLTLLSQGFGGGTRIAGCLAAFNARYAKSTIDSRSVVVVMSDGYDTDPPERLAGELARLKKRARRLVWLNPLPADTWAGSTAGELARHVPMFPMDRLGMYRAVDVLRGHPIALERPLTGLAS